MGAGAPRDVLVVGGGPAGAAAAVFLRRAGLDVLLVDEARFPRDKVCGESVSPQAWRLLRELGADEAVRGLSPHAMRGMEVRSPSGARFRGDYPAEPGFAVRRLDLDRVLLERARVEGVEVREGWQARGLLVEEGRVQGAVLANGAGPVPCRARLVVGADGRRSVVARRLGLLREDTRWRRFSVRGHWQGMAGLGEHGEMHVAGGSYCGVAPLGAGRANVAFVVGQDEMKPAAGDLAGFYRRTLRRWPELAERLEGARLLGAPRAIGPLALVARRAWAPGALLVGDSAGFYDPFTGEGIALALRSAELGARVASTALRSRAGAFDLSEYGRLREQATRDKFRFNRIVQRIVGWPALADAVARRLSRRPDLADRLVGVAGDCVPARRAEGVRLLADLVLA